MGCGVGAERGRSGWRGVPESCEQERNEIIAGGSGAAVRARHEGGGMCQEALTEAKYLWFAGSDVLRWISQRLWVSSLGESSLGPQF